MQKAMLLQQQAQQANQVVVQGGIASSLWDFELPWYASLGLGFVPGVGEALDVVTLFHPKSTMLDRGLSAASLAINAATWGFAPNFGTASATAAKQLDDVGDKLVDYAQSLLKVLNPTCFAAGTPLLTPEGSKPVEEFRAGDWVLARNEHDPHGPVVPRMVEKVHTQTATLVELRVGGQAIKTTGPHPFYVAGRGWVYARELQPGDQLLGHSGSPTVVESVTITEQAETVYNLTVAEDHTYFVGDASWGFSLWVHNDYTPTEVSKDLWRLLDDAGNPAVKPDGTLWEFPSKSDADAEILKWKQQLAQGTPPKNAPGKLATNVPSNVYNSIRDALGDKLKGFAARANGLTKNNINNTQLLAKLRDIEAGKWQKVYKDGIINGEKVSIHFFQSPSGKVFDVKIVSGWSN